MSFQEKRSLLSLVCTGLLVILFVSIIAPASSFEPRRWGLAFLVAVPSGILIQILLTIGLAIVNKATTQEDPPKGDDERDRFVSLKSTRNGYISFGAGFLTAMATQVFGAPVSVLFAVLAASCLSSSVIGDLSRFIYYRRGL
jgi:hypothetical protein